MGLEILSDLSKILPYPIPDFPLYAGIGKLAAQNQYTVGCHFHPDFEFSLVLEGVMDYFINGENVHLGTGDGIFVNSQRLHYNYSRNLTPCRYLVITVSPTLFPKELPAVEQLMAGKTTPECSDYVLLEKDDNKPVLSLYPKILHEIQTGNPNVFLTLSYVLALCGAVVPMIQSDAHGDAHDAKWLSLYDMTKYIHTHYQEKVTLSDIAAAGKVCRSRCCQIFTRYMGQSPIDYLIFYRLKKSQELLQNTDCSIGEVASRCGFGGQSYYTQMFRRFFGVTPRMYRK